MISFGSLTDVGDKIKREKKKGKEILPGFGEAGTVKERHVKERVYVRETHTK